MNGREANILCYHFIISIFLTHVAHMLMCILSVVFAGRFIIMPEYFWRTSYGSLSRGEAKMTHLFLFV